MSDKLNLCKGDVCLYDGFHVQHGVFFGNFHGQKYVICSETLTATISSPRTRLETSYGYSASSVSGTRPLSLP